MPHKNRVRLATRVDGNIDDAEIEHVCHAVGQCGFSKIRSRRCMTKDGNRRCLPEGKSSSSAFVCWQNRCRQVTLQLSSKRMGNLATKEWNPIFLKSRPPPISTESFVESKRKLEAEDDGIDLFLRDAEDSAPWYYFDEVREFCHGASLEALQIGRGSAGYNRAAWLDARRFSCQAKGGSVEPYPNPLTPKSLYQLLKGNAVSMNRVLIYIANLDPDFILALAETAPFDQVEALRDAIRKHLAFQSSFRVQSRVLYYTTFQLDVHVTYFSLRKYPQSSEKLSQIEAASKTVSKQWIDLSFLELPTPKSEEKRIDWGLYKSRFSLVICGSDHRNWKGYAFVDRDLEELEFDEEDLQYVGLHADPIASDSGVHVIDANKPIRDPRAYLLVIFKIRIAIVLEAWEKLIRLLDDSIKTYKQSHASNSLWDPKKKEDNAPDVKEAYWIQRILDLMEHLLEVLTETVEAWEVFHSSGGDIGYFQEVGSSKKERDGTRRAIECITQTFERLKFLQKKLSSLNEKCQNLASSFNLRLAVESNNASKHTVTTAQWTISVFSPIALAIAYFSMPETVIPFKPNFKSFLIAVVVMGAIVQLLFFAFGGALSQLIKAAKSNGTIPQRFPSIHTYGSYLVAALARRPRNAPISSQEGIETDNV